MVSHYQAQQNVRKWHLSYAVHFTFLPRFSLHLTSILFCQPSIPPIQLCVSSSLAQFLHFSISTDSNFLSVPLIHSASQCHKSGPLPSFFPCFRFLRPMASLLVGPTLSPSLSSELTALKAAKTLMMDVEVNDNDEEVANNTETMSMTTMVTTMTTTTTTTTKKSNQGWSDDDGVCLFASPSDDNQSLWLLFASDDDQSWK